MPAKKEPRQELSATTGFAPHPGAEQQGDTRETAVLALQRSAGNAALAALLRQGSPLARRGSAVQRDAVAEAKKLLSYDLVSGNFVITDEDATQALAHLRTYSGAGLLAALARMGTTSLERLVDNLPVGLQKGSTFAAVLIALGDARVASYVSGLPKGTHLSKTQKSLLGTLFRRLGDAKLDLLLQIIETRFFLPFKADPTKGAASVPWEAKGLRRSWRVLEKLPPAHVEENTKLMEMLRYERDGVGGYYSKSREIASIGYKPGNLKDLNQSIEGKKKDPLHGVNRFDKVVRHEVGHAVDARMGWTTGAEPAKAARGGWKQYGAAVDTVAQDMIVDANGGIKALTAAQQADVVKDMKFVFANTVPATLLTRIKARPWYAGLKKSEKKDIAKDPLLKAVTRCLASASPWGQPTGGVALSGRIYMQSYAGPDRWNRYNAEARTRKVSKYQFRAPGEWFAEAYAAYYDPASEGKGKLLQAADASTKKYFDDVVTKL